MLAAATFPKNDITYSTEVVTRHSPGDETPARTSSFLHTLGSYGRDMVELMQHPVETPTDST